MADPEIMTAIVTALNDVVREDNDKALAEVAKAAHLLTETRTRSTRRNVMLALLEGVRRLADYNADHYALDTVVDELPESARVVLLTILQERR